MQYVPKSLFDMSNSVDNAFQYMLVISLITDRIPIAMTSTQMQKCGQSISMFVTWHIVNFLCLFIATWRRWRKIPVNQYMQNDIELTIFLEEKLYEHQDQHTIARYSTYFMLGSVNSSAGSQIEVRIGSCCKSRLYLVHGLYDWTELQSSNTCRWKKGSENHLISGGNTHDNIYAHIKPLQKPATRPPGTKNDHPWLFSGPSRFKTWISVPLIFRIRLCQCPLDDKKLIMWGCPNSSALVTSTI